MGEFSGGVFIGMLVGVFLTIMVVISSTYGVKTGRDVEIINSVCDYIYENESQDIYLKYCK